MKSPVVNFVKRISDDFGCGHFGAPRGDHKHKGQDLLTTSGEDIFSPIDGKITKNGYTYPDDLSYRYPRIENDAYMVDLYYTKLNGYKVGDKVTVFDAIANSQDIAARYNEKYKKKDGTFKVMKNHCHIQVYDKKLKKWVDPMTVLEF